MGNFPHFVTYTLLFHSPPNTQTIPKVSTTKDLRIVLNTRLGAKDDVVSATNKVRRMLLYLKRSYSGSLILNSNLIVLFHCPQSPLFS